MREKPTFCYETLHYSWRFGDFLDEKVSLRKFYLSILFKNL